MQNKFILALVSAAILIIAGCSEMNLREGFGESTENNRNVQSVNPSAEYTPVPPATLDGQKAEKVIKEYRQEKAEAPTEVMTQ